MQYVFNEPIEYTFQGRDGHDGKLFATSSPVTNHLIIECTDRLTVMLRQNNTEFNYYVITGNGFFEIEEENHIVSMGDLIVIPPGTKYSFGGTLRMLLINTPHWAKDQEDTFPLED